MLAPPSPCVTPNHPPLPLRPPNVHLLLYYQVVAAANVFGGLAGGFKSRALAVKAIVAASRAGKAVVLPSSQEGKGKGGGGGGLGKGLGKGKGLGPGKAGKRGGKPPKKERPLVVGPAVPFPPAFSSDYRALLRSPSFAPYAR